MTTPSFKRIFSVIALGLSLVTLTGRADPVSNDLFSAGVGGLAPLGLPDRDVVRNPYSALLGAGGSNPGIQNLGVVGPNLGLGVGFTPGIILGGGGGGGGILPSSLGFSASPLIGGPSNSVGSNSSTSGGNIALNAPAVLPIVLPPGGGSAQTTSESNLVAPESVPEGGQSAIMLGAGLLTAYFLRRRLAANK